jgi:DNA-binding PadR family transcriptional regulator
LGSVWQIKLSQLYALLDKLERAAYVFTTTEQQENKPPRKLFHLTTTGEAAFLAWVERPVANGRSLRLEFLVKLYFARQEGGDVAARLLAEQCARCQEWLTTQESLVVIEEQNGREYGRLVHQFRLGQIQTMLNWLNYCNEDYWYDSQDV